MKRARWIPWLATIAGACGLFWTGCGSPDEVVAHISKPEAGPTITVGMMCSTSSDCGFVDGGGEFFCSKMQCTDPMGTCQPRPTTCPNDFYYSCGCTTHLLYQNDCLRQQHGDTANAGQAGQTCKPTQCTAADAGACTEGSYCALPEPNCKPPADPRDMTGVCWVLPEQCPTQVSVPGVGIPIVQVIDCANPTSPCTDYCTAVRRGRPFSVPTQTMTCSP